MDKERGGKGQGTGREPGLQEKVVPLADTGRGEGFPIRQVPTELTWEEET